MRIVVNEADVYDTGFNPRTRVGCENMFANDGEFGSVSIHAPVWGAKINLFYRIEDDGFNPRTRVGCELL